MKYHLTTVSVSGPLVKGEYASELFHVFDISEVHDWLPISWIEILYSRMISASTYMMTGSGTLNPTIRANRQVVVRQYTRGLRIALEFNDVLVSVVRGHELSLRAAAEATNVLNCRSEEHTSELQSRLHLVCRLLLEKKKKISVSPRYRSSLWRFSHFRVFILFFF